MGLSDVWPGEVPVKAVAETEEPRLLEAENNTSWSAGDSCPSKGEQCEAGGGGGLEPKVSTAIESVHKFDTSSLSMPKLLDSSSVGVNHSSGNAEDFQRRHE